MPLASGQTLSFYEILSPLGAGAMGEVYRARDTRLDRDVAIKVLPEHFAEDDDRLRRFEREAKTLASVNHPNVAAIYGVDQVGDTCFMAMELVPGEDLAAHLARGPLPLDEALAICRQIALGLETAHEAGVVHRDLKPANVRITPDGLVKVLDFGLAKEIVPQAGSGVTSAELDSVLVTADGLVLGTPTYMSPEQARGKPVDRRTDIWSFGCVLFESLTGRKAFSGESFSDLMAAILGSTPDWSALPADTPRGVRRVLLRCLQREKERRYRSIGDVLLDLDPVEWAVDDAVASAGDATVLGALARTAFRARRAALLACTVALITTVGWLVAARAVPPPVPPPPRLATSIPLPDGLQTSRSIALTLDGRTLAFAGRDALGDTHLYLRDLDDFAFRQVAGSQDGSHPFFSPDGRWLGFEARQSLWRVSVDGGNPVKLTDCGAFTTSSWGADGQIVFSNSVGSELWTLDEGGGEARPLTKLADDPLAYAHVWPHHIPGTRKLLFTSWTGGPRGGARILDLDTGAFRRLSNSDSDDRRTSWLPPVRWSASGHLILEAGDNGLLVTPFDPDSETQVSRGAAHTLLENVWHLGSSTQSVFALSETGTLAYVPGNPDDTRLVWVDVNGAVTEVLHQEVVNEYCRLGDRPILSADETRVLIGGGGDMIELDLVRGIPRRLTFEDGNDVRPQWTPDETAVVFDSNAESRWSIWSLGLQPGATPELRLQREDNTYCFDVGRDGALLIGVSTEDRGTDMWVVDADGTTRTLVATRSEEYDGQFSPDQAWVAYQSDISGDWEIYVTAADGRGTPVQVTSAGGQAPLWAASGERIYFRRGADVFRIDLRDGRPVGLAEPAFPAPDLAPGLCYAIAADETRMLALQLGDQARHDTIRVVTDFFDVIRAVAPPGSR